MVDTQALELRRNGEAPSLPALPLEADTARLAMAMAKSGYFSDVKDAAQAVVKIIAGKEMGFGPVASMTGIYLVQGKVTVGANLMAAAIKRSGRYSYHVDHLDDTGCTITFLEKGESIGVSSFTQDDAKKASLLNKSGPWTTFPRNMYFARALSNGCRWYCPDVFGGPIYTPEEMGAKVDDEGNVVHHEAPEPRYAIERNVEPEAVDQAPQAAPVAEQAKPAIPDPGELDAEFDALGREPTSNAPAWANTALGRQVSAMVDALNNVGAKFTPPPDDADEAALKGWISSKRGVLQARGG